MLFLGAYKKLFSMQAKPIFIYILPFLLLIGVFISSLIPPLQSPDEHDHLKRAYLLSKGRIMMETPEGQSTGGRIDTGLNTYLATFNYLPGKPNNKLGIEVQEKAESIKWSGLEQFGSCPGVSYYFPLIYLPQATGLFIGQLLDLSVSHSYYLARYLAFFSAIVIILLAFSIHRLSFFNIALLITPLALFQFVATSQDGVAIALVVLAGSLFLKITGEGNKHNLLHFNCMCLIILLLTTSRINLLPMLIMPFAAAYFTGRAAKAYWISGGIVVISLLWVFYALLTTVDKRVVTGAPTAEIILYYVKDPIEFLNVLWETLQHHQLPRFYVASFIGILGWLDTSIGDTYINIIFYSLLIILVFSISFKSLKKERWQRGILLLVAFSSILLTFFLLLITWNEHPAKIIQGVQGRYFWAPMILFGFGFTSNSYHFSSIKKWIAFFALLVILIVSVFIVPKTLLSRYFIAPVNNQPSTFAVILKARGTIISAKEQNFHAERGGFIDSMEYKNGGLMLRGWGFFEKDEKEFISNQKEAINVKYLTIERPDVVEALAEKKLAYAGFELIIPAENAGHAEKIMQDFCLYSKDSSFGIKQIQPGGSNMLYKCGDN